MSKLLKLEEVEPNPNQPRKNFPDDHIRGLAASIKKRGLIQPISVRQIGPRRYMIVSGECRWRAHKLLNAKTIKAEVETMDVTEMRLRAIVENVQRRDMNPIEEANAYRSLLDDGMTADQIVEELGLKSTAVVHQRLVLLDLREDIQGLVASGNIPVTMAWGIAQAPSHCQSQIMRDISEGKLRTSEQVKHAGIAIREAHAQMDAFAMAPRASEKDVASLRTLEAKIEAISDMVMAGYKEGELMAARRVNPSRAKALADKLTLIRKHVLQMEHDLRREAITGQIQLDMGAH